MAKSNNTTTPTAETSGLPLIQANHAPVGTASDVTTDQGKETLKEALIMAIDCGVVGCDYISKHCLPVLRSIVELSDMTNLSAEAINSRIRSISELANLGVYLADVAENDIECQLEKAHDELYALRTAAA